MYPGLEFAAPEGVTAAERSALYAEETEAFTIAGAPGAGFSMEGTEETAESGHCKREGKNGKKQQGKAPRK